MRRFLLVSCILLASCSMVHGLADVSEIGIGARPLGLGRAFSSGIDDASSIFTNPAGLALNPHFNILSMSGTLLSDVNYVVLGVCDDSPIGKVGIGYVNASVGGIPITTLTGSGSTAAIVLTGSTDYTSSIVFISYATKLDRIFRGRGKNISVGANLKLYSQNFSGGGSVMQNAAGSGADADLGIIWEATSRARFGVTFKNFLPVDFGGRFQWESGGEAESLPMSIRTGGRLKILGNASIQQRDDEGLNLLVDYESGGEDGRPGLWHTGIEYWPLDLMCFRVGLDQRVNATEAGIGIDNNLTGGVGISYRGFTFDYAYHQFGELAENTTHFFSIGFRGVDKEIRRRGKREERRGILPVLEVVPKPELVTFSDLPEDYWARKPIEYLSTLKIMGGYPDGTFRPNQAISRGELAVLLVKAKGFDANPINEWVFRDVPPKNWMAPYIKKAIERKYMAGYPNGTFLPNQAVTRVEAAVIFSKFGGLYVKPKVSERVFPDIRKGHWASPAIAASKEAGFFEFLSGEKFGTGKPLTRAEAAEMLSKTPTVKNQIKKLISGEE